MSKEPQAEASKELDTSARHAPEQAEETWCPGLELRHDLHHWERREKLTALFNEYFIAKE